MVESYGYGNWFAVIIWIFIFGFFVLSFIKPVKKREWRSAGVFTAFIIALFTEMYGIPLTIYAISSVFGIPLSLNHMEGHLWATLLARAGILDMQIGWMLVMIMSSAAILSGFLLLILGWRGIYYSNGGLAVNGIYAFIRHPQYLGIFFITTGLLIQWPTLITLAMWPVLIIMFYRLAKKEEAELEDIFGSEFLNYRNEIPRFIPRLR